jgi:hypothetical protein
MTKLIRLRSLLLITLTLLACTFGSKRAEALCDLPTGLTTTNITTTTAKLNWASTVADSFLVRYQVTGTVNYFYKRVSSGSATSTTISGLYPFTHYSWLVHTYCDSGQDGGYQPSPAQFTTLPGTVACVIPNGTTTTAIGPNSALLSWSTSITADSFLIRYAPRNTTNYTWIKVPGNVHSYLLINLPPNIGYDWRVRCICASNPVQSYSILNTFFTLSSTCGSADPYYFNVTNIGYSSATLGWKPVPGAISYNVRYAIRYSNNWTQISATGNTKGLNGLQANTWYEFQVQVVCASGAGPWSTSGIFQTTTAFLSLTRGPYLNLSTTSSIYLRWRTGIPSDSRVKYGISPANLNMTTDDATLTTEHIVQLTGLTANTKYYYSIGSTSVTLQGDTGNYFKTNPVVGSTAPIRIWTIGDFGVSTSAQYQVRDAYANYPGSANTNLWLWVGDNAYSDGTDLEYQNHVFSKYPYQMKKWTIWPATGNHDLHTAIASSQSGPYFDNFTLPKSGEAGGLPSSTEAYYSFNYGNIHFVCLESTDAPFRAASGAQATWLANDLAANTQRWTIVYFHHPPYSKGSHDSDVSIEMVEMRTQIIPILENFKVDLVLAGHSHAYERSMMIKGHYQNENTFVPGSHAVNAGSGTFPSPYLKTSPNFSGTVYVVCGTSGQKGSTSTGWPHNAMFASSVNYYGSLVIDVVGDRLDCKFLTNAGSIYDQFTIQKYGVALRKAVESNDPAFPAGDRLTVFPNPMVHESTIRYIVDENQTVRMEVTDLTGRVLYTLADGHHDKGEYEIKLIKSEAILPGGIYFIRMTVGEQSYLKKIVIN